MARATVTSKGQVTIPAEVRRRLGIATGTTIDFVWREPDRYELVVSSSSVTALRGVIPPPERPVSLEEMDDAIRSGAMGSGLA